MATLPMRTLLAAALLVPLGTGCSASHPLELPAAPLHRASAADDPDAYPGLPREWRPWVGIDPFEEVPPMDWASHLDAGLNDAAPSHDFTGQGCLFEVTQRVGPRERRWFVLIKTDPHRSIEMKPATFTIEGRAQPLKVPFWFLPTRVSVAPAGKEPGVAREVALPLLEPHLGYTVGVAAELAKEYDRRGTASQSEGDVYDTFVATTTRPGAVLLALFLGIQEHSELSSILREVVDAPGLLGVLFAGGLRMNLATSTDEARPVRHALKGGQEVEGVVFPASVSVNGDLALELLITATESVRPVRVMGGLVELEASRPGRTSETVTLTLIGAGTGRAAPLAGDRELSPETR